jgi:hypothetical protein
VRPFLSGLICAGAAVIALHFHRFRRESGDRLFGAFSVAFALMAANHAALAFVDPDAEARIAVYGLRLAAYALILYAVVRTNRRAS